MFNILKVYLNSAIECCAYTTYSWLAIRNFMTHITKLGAISKTMKIVSFTIVLLYLLSGCHESQQIKQDVKIDSVSIRGWSKEPWYNVRYQSLCDDSKGIFVDLKKVKKYGNYNPYDTIQKVFKDSTIISFDFISDCCIEYSGEVINRNDSLFLGYGLATDTVSPCDCYCDYRMTYYINTKDRHWNKIIIKHGRLK